MKLHSDEFEKALRSAVRTAVKSSAALKKDFKAANKLRRHYPARLVFRPVLSVVLGLSIHAVLERTNVTTALGLLNLWTFAFIAVQAQRLLANLYNSADLSAFAFLPVETSVIFRWELQKSIRGALWLLLDLVCGYAAFAIHQNSIAAWSAFIPMAFLTWAHVLALAALGVARRPNFPYGLISTLVFMGMFVVAIARDAIGAKAIALLAAAAPAMNLILPSGWVPSLFEGVLTKNLLFLILLLPIAATLFTLKGSLQRMSGGCDFIEPIEPEAPDLLPDESDGVVQTDDAAAVWSSSRDGVPRVGVTEICDIIERRQFLSSPAWHKVSWLERTLWRWLTPRERVLIDFISPDGVALLPSWLKLFRNFGITVAAVLAARTFFGPGIAAWLLAPGLFLTGSHMLSLLAGTGRAFQQLSTSGVNIPFYAGFALGFRELSRLFAKVAVVQLPLIGIFSVAATALTFFTLGQPVGAALPFGLKLAGLLFGARFVFLAFSFSSGTNDTSSVLRPRTLLMIAFVAFFCLGFLGLAVAALMTPEASVSWMCCAAAVGIAWLFLKTYGAFYHAKLFDLMNVPQQQL